MGRSTRNCVAGFLVLGLMVRVGRAQTLSKSAVLGSRTLGPADSKLRITLWVYNYAQVPAETLRDAENQVETILRRAGVSTDWIKCPVSAAEVQSNPVCQDRMSAAVLALTILPQFKPTPESHADTYFGVAQVFTDGQFGHYAYVFYDQVQDPALRSPASVSQMLGHVAAHELGHVLLRSTAHSPTGLMRAQWDRSDLQRAAWGYLGFTTQESQLVREEVRSRMDKTKVVQAAQ